MQLALVALAFAVVAFVLWLSSLSRAKAQSARIASLLVDNGALSETQKHLTEQQKKQMKLLEQRSEEVLELKKEIGALKKKNFTLQEDAKKTKSSFEAKLEEREKMLTARPAFETAEPPPKKPMKAEISKSEPVPSPVPVSAAADSEALRRVESLARDNDAMATTVAELKNELRSAQSNMRRMKKCVDDYRRADLVAKGRIDLLADKLGSMGRQYYDAISELAAVKGEVKPPVPRDVAYAKEQAENVAKAESAAEARGNAEAHADEPSVADATHEEVSALSQAVVETLQRNVH